MSSSSSRRPNLLTMEGMIWNAHHVLDTALSVESNGGVPRGFFQQCKGVILMTVHEVGVVLSGNVGTGVIMSHDGHEKTWSAPSAIGMHGVGLGILAGYAAKDVIIMIMGDEYMQRIAGGRFKLTLSGQSGITHGKDMSRSHDDLDTFNETQEGAWGFMYSKGYFASIALEAAALRTHHKQNHKFYGRDVTPQEILLEGGVSGNERIQQLHEKLNLLAAGKTKEPTPAEVDEKEIMRESAIKAGEEAEKELGDEVEYVNVQEEAKKEAEQAETTEEAQGAATTTTEKAEVADAQEEKPKEAEGVATTTEKAEEEASAQEEETAKEAEGVATTTDDAGTQQEETKKEAGATTENVDAQEEGTSSSDEQGMGEC